jgi:hypothetical protein
MDNKEKKAADRDRIDVNERYELEYWSQKFKVSQDQLKNAVERVGPMVRDVEDELNKAA